MKEKGFVSSLITRRSVLRVSPWSVCGAGGIGESGGLSMRQGEVEQGGAVAGVGGGYRGGEEGGEGTQGRWYGEEPCAGREVAMEAWREERGDGVLPLSR